MDDITLNLIVLAVLVVIGSAIFILVRRNQKAEEQKIRQLADANGWTYETVRKPLTWGFRLKSARWMLESLSVSSGQESDSGSSNVAMSTTWKADSSGPALLAGVRTSQANLGEMGDMLARRVLQAALGRESEGLSDVRIGSLAFQQKYMVWAKDTFAAEQVLIPSVQSALLAWKGTLPLIKSLSSGLTIELQGVHLKKAEQIQALIGLGDALLATIQA